MNSINRRILHEMLSLPTAPFAEHYVIEYLRQFCIGLANLSWTRDAAGNVLIRVHKGKRKVTRPVCITAHLDHPGFVAERMISGFRVQAYWRGGVPKEYFVGSDVRFWVSDAWVPGRVRSIKTVLRDGQHRVDTAVIEVAEEVPPGSIGMWDLPGPKVLGTRIHAVPCDDLAGGAALLCAIGELARTPGSCDAYFLFTRAEEVGFAGAIAAARLKTIPRKCYVVAMETSAERGHAKMGNGPILRVGDRASTFTSAATEYCHRIARELAAAHKTFHYQRQLMDGGTCESSAYCMLGHEATGLCLALGNYHNVDLKRKRLGPEYVDLNDFDHAVTWFVELARAPRPYTGCDETLRTRLTELDRTYRRLLRRSLDRPC